MKRILLICLVFCLLISVSAISQVHSFKGESMISGNMGYAFGMGDAFPSYTEPITNTKFSTDAGMGFSGQYYYGVKDNLLIGGEVMFQSYTSKLSSPANLALSIPATDISVSQTETNILVNALYAVNQTRNSTLFLIGGTGFYDFGGMELGINTGLLWRKQVGDNWHIFGMPRLHIVMADNTPMMFQLTMGAQFSL